MDNKKRLIDADALQRRICGAKCGCEYEDCGNEGDCEFDFFIFHAPTVDAVEVVRCKDCKYRTWFCPNYGCGNYDSPFYAGVPEDVPIMTNPDDFCSYGERKDNE